MIIILIIIIIIIIIIVNLSAGAHHGYVLPPTDRYSHTQF